MSRSRTAWIVDAEIALGRWRQSTGRGTVAQAAFDEDAVTLAARCGLDVLERHPDVRPSALIVASLSAPLPEPGIAPFLCEVFDLQTSPERRGVEVLELGGTVASGLAAVSSAITRVSAGLGPVLVIATDDRRDTRNRPLGAGAAALLVSDVGTVAEIESVGAASELFLDRWQQRDAPGVHTGDRSLDRFSPGRAFAESFTQGQALRSGAAGPAIERAGFPGVAAPLVWLFTSNVSDGEAATVSASAGGVSHAIEVTAGAGFADVATRAQSELAGGLDSDRPADPDESAFDPFRSDAIAWRERAQAYRLEGARDPESGEIFFPPPPAAAGEGLEPFRLARRGTVVTFARDHVFPVGAPLTMAVIDLAGGGRFYGQVVDGLEVEIGDPVELVLRRLHQGGGVPNYFWKAQPTGEAS